MSLSFAMQHMTAMDFKSQTVMFTVITLQFQLIKRSFPHFLYITGDILNRSAAIRQINLLACVSCEPHVIFISPSDVAAAKGYFQSLGKGSQDRGFHHLP